MRILIVTKAYPPLNTIGANRPYSWAKYWSAAGHEVTVLTTKKSGGNVSLSLPLVPCEHWEVPEPGIHLLRGVYHRFLRAGRPTNAASSREPSRIARWCGLGLKILRERFEFLHTGRMPSITDLWIAPAVRRARRGGLRWDLLVSTSGPYATHVIAARLKRAGHARCWVADYRDLWSANPAVRGNVPFPLVERRWERSLMAHADLITVVSEVNRRIMADEYGLDKVQVVTNGFDPDDHSRLDPQPAFPDDGKLRLVYTGSIYPRQSAEALFASIRALKSNVPDITRRLELVFAGPRLGRLEDLARAHGLADCVVTFGLLSRQTAYRMQRDASALVFLDWGDSRAGMLTGKLYEYLFCDTPTLCIGGFVDSPAADLIRAVNAGYVFGNDVSRLTSFLDEALRSGFPSPGERRPEVLLPFTRQALADRMLDLVRRAERETS